MNDIPFVEYESPILREAPVQLRPPSYIRADKMEKEFLEVGFCICLFTIGFCIGVIYGVIVL